MQEQAISVFWRGKTGPFGTGEALSLPLCAADDRDQISYVGSSLGVEPATTSNLDDVARCNVPRCSAPVPWYSRTVLRN